MSFRRKTKRDPEFVKNQDLLKKEVMESIAANSDKSIDLLEYFLKSVLPETEYNYYLFVKNKGGIPVNLKFNYNEYIKALIAITDYEYEAYYFPVAFTKWRDNEGTFNHFKCFYVDVDHTGINTLNMNSDEMAEFIKVTYNVPESIMPHFCVSSGSGGFHAVWLVEDIYDTEIRDKFTRSMITYFGGDYNAFPRSHPFRIPFSNNCKRDIPIKSKLMILSDNPRYRISDLEFFSKSESEIDEYFTHEKAKTTAKRLATIEKKKQNHSAPAVKEEDRISKNQHTKHSKDKSDYDTSPIKNVKYHTKFNKKARYSNLLGDLNNYFVRRGCNINGYRHTFIFLIANYARLYMSQYDCIEHCSQYVSDNFYDEMIEIIENVYSRGYTYYYNYNTISKLLNFSDIDLEKSFCAFSDEIKTYRRKERQKAYYQKKTEHTLTESYIRRETNKLIIANNPDKTVEELMELCQLSKSSIYRIRKEIKNENKY